MRHRPLLKTLVVSTLLTFAAVPAADANWLGLPGLNGANGASFVREYTTGMPPTTMYAATEAGGVMRSVNNGVSWAPFNSGLENIPGAKDVRAVFTSGTTVYAGTSAGLFKNAGGGFQPVAQGAEDDPKNPKKLNAAVQAVFTGILPGSPMLAGVASGGVYKSTDGGATWKPPAPGNGMVKSETVWSLGSFKDNGAIVYAATQSGIYISTDFGSTWTLSNDGIKGITLRAWADDKYPNIYYAAGSEGLFRSVNLGLTWHSVNGEAGPYDMEGGTVRAITQFSGIDTKRIYAGTDNGVWAMQTDNSPLPGKVKWRKLTMTGLDKPIIWGLTSYINTPGTLIAGSSGGGGYALVLTPPIHTAVKPTLNDTTPLVGQTLEVQSNGSWTGTPTIEFTYQWQDCTAVCVDIDGATDSTFIVPAQNRKYRVEVIAQNDFPTGGLVTAVSDPTSASGPKPGTLPGDNQSNTGSIKVIPDTAFPQPGMVLQAQGFMFNPAATLGTDFQWSQCVNGVCEPIKGATSSTYALTDQDVGKRLCVQVTGKNVSGSKTLDCTGVTNEIFPPNPKQTSAPTIGGTAYVGQSLLSGVGTWAYPGTRFERRWQRCNADGTSCETLVDNTSTYTLKPADLGKRMRVELTVDSNIANKIPSPVTVYTPLSDVVTNEPVLQDPQNGGGGNGGGGNGGGGGGNPQPQPQPQPQPLPADTLAPVLKSAKAASAKLKSGAALSLKINVNEGGKLLVEYRKGKKKVASFKVSVAAGSRTVKLAKKKLAKGSYKAIVTPVDAAGNKGKAKTVTFKVVRR
jgi:hypothetical protein